MNKIIFIDGSMKGTIRYAEEIEMLIEFKRWCCPYFPHKPYQITHEYELLNDINMGQRVLFYRIKEIPVKIIRDDDMSRLALFGETTRLRAAGYYD